ncbi:MAG: helicase-associated domain-containing protein, partial [Actinomycetota bacterium]|nr:helicase-associated domain-containing protein [Actinomycetota bacterium]
MRILVDELRSWPDERLVALLRIRPDLVVPVPPDLRTLAARAGGVPSVNRALDRLDRFALQVAEVLCVAPEPTCCDEVRRLLGADAARALRVLCDAALVWGDEALHCVPALRQALPFPAGLGPPLDTLPGAVPVAIASALRDPHRLDALVAEVSPAAREVLTRLAEGPPTGSVANADRRVEVATARTPVEELLARGLLVPVDRVTVVLPREVGLRLRGGRAHPEVLPEPPPLTLLPAADADAVAAAAADVAVRQVEELLELWSVEGPPVLKSGGLGVRELRKAAGLLDLEERVVALLAEVAYAAGLVGPGGELDETWLPTLAYDAWREKAAAARWVDLAEAWRATTRGPGLAGTRDERDKVLVALGPGLDRVAAPELRAGVLAELAALPAGTAAGEESIAARLQWRRPRQGPALRRALVGWSVSEAEHLGVTGRGALAGHARALLGGEPGAAVERLAPLLPAPLDFVLLQADLTAVAPGPLTSELAAELGLMADIESRGAATVYRFRDLSVRRALDAGRTAADLHAFLAGHSRTPVPQPLTYLVDDLARRHGRIRVGTASAYVRGDDESVLSELLAHRRTASLRLRRLAPTVLAAEVPAEVLLDRLRALGYA